MELPFRCSFRDLSTGGFEPFLSRGLGPACGGPFLAPELLSGLTIYGGPAEAPVSRLWPGVRSVPVRPSGVRPPLVLFLVVEPYPPILSPVFRPSLLRWI